MQGNKGKIEKTLEKTNKQSRVMMVTREFGKSFKGLRPGDLHQIMNIITEQEKKQNIYNKTENIIEIAADTGGRKVNNIYNRRDIQPKDSNNDSIKCDPKNQLQKSAANLNYPLEDETLWELE